jgi:ACT domain-containing protein
MQPVQTILVFLEGFQGKTFVGVLILKQVVNALSHLVRAVERKGKSILVIPIDNCLEDIARPTL